LLLKHPLYAHNRVLTESPEFIIAVALFRHFGL
jgi:hypothetical protein